MALRCVQDRNRCRNHLGGPSESPGSEWLPAWLDWARRPRASHALWAVSHHLLPLAGRRPRCKAVDELADRVCFRHRILGSRWNRAFRDLTHAFLFRPLISTVGPEVALLIGFLASGIIHDVTISLPSGGGYGGPTAFFILQSLAILLERSRLGLQLGLGGRIRGQTFTAATVILPAPFLFHPQFVNQVILPFLQAIGAGP